MLELASCSSVTIFVMKGWPIGHLRKVNMNPIQWSLGYFRISRIILKEKLLFGFNSSYTSYNTFISCNLSIKGDSLLRIFVLAADFGSEIEWNKAILISPLNLIKNRLPPSAFWVLNRTSSLQDFSCNPIDPLLNYTSRAIHIRFCFLHPLKHRLKSNTNGWIVSPLRTKVMCRILFSIDWGCMMLTDNSRSSRVTSSVSISIQVNYSWGLMSMVLVIFVCWE